MGGRVESVSMSCDSGVEVSGSGDGVGMRNFETCVDAPGLSGRDSRGSPKRERGAQEAAVSLCPWAQRPR